MLANTTPQLIGQEPANILTDQQWLPTDEIRQTKNILETKVHPSERYLKTTLTAI